MPIMSTFLQRHQASLSLSAAATLGAVAATTVIYATFALRRRVATEDLKVSIPEISGSHKPEPLAEYGGAKRDTISSTEDVRTAKIASRARKGDYDEELILEQLARNRVFLKDDGLRKLRNAFVVVVGLGGVGSHCVAALARSGVERIRIVDFDQVTLSSLNRHALATLADVGSPKVQCVRRRLEHIVPWVRVDARGELLSSSTEESLLSPWNYELRDDEEGTKVDWVVDAIDNIDTKVELLRYCTSKGIKVISAMGAGCKSDPTMVMVGDISTSFEDPLSHATRRRLKLLGVRDGIPVVFSTEKPGPGKAELQSVSEREVEKGDVRSLGVLPDFRVRILPVLGTMPAVFGYTLASHIICSLADYPLEYRAGERGREKMYDGMLLALQGMLRRLVRHERGDDIGLRVPLTRDDVSYLVEEVYRGKSVVSGLSTRLALSPWRRPGCGFQGLVAEEDGQKYIRMTMTDLVLMTKEEGQKHEKQVLNAERAPEDVYDVSVTSLVRRRYDEEQAYDKYR